MHFPILLLLLLAAQLLLPFHGAFNGVADFKSGELLTREWMEIGFVDLDDAEWVTVTTKSLTFNLNDDTNLAIFISLPSYGGIVTCAYDGKIVNVSVYLCCTCATSC